MYLYLNKKHEALVPQIAQALREMKADGTYNKIMFSIISE
jgi:polar amino acid transport system substrate-binding protein